MRIAGYWCYPADRPKVSEIGASQSPSVPPIPPAGQGRGPQRLPRLRTIEADFARFTVFGDASWRTLIYDGTDSFALHG